MTAEAQVFAGLPVRDLSAALDWYAALFGRPTGLEHSPSTRRRLLRECSRLDQSAGLASAAFAYWRVSIRY